MKELWKVNVGTHEQPVSYLHEYAVGMIWEALHSQKPVHVLTKTGEVSSELKQGMTRCAIPDAATAIAGTIPDLAIYDSNHRPIRVVEVECTSPTKDDVIQRRSNLGVETILVEVKNEDDLFNILKSESELNGRNDPFMPSHELLNQRQWYGYRPVLMDRGNRTFMPDITVVNQSVVNSSQQQEFRRGQRDADDIVRNFMSALASCSPQVRREFREMMSEMNDVHALYPISAANPKFEALRNAYREFTNGRG